MVRGISFVIAHVGLHYHIFRNGAVLSQWSPLRAVRLLRVSLDRILKMPTPKLPRIRLKRVYAARSDDDGPRLLVERLWPRGLKRSEAGIDRWFKTMAPSPNLRRWYDHVPERWPEFRRRYVEELNAARGEEIDELIELCLRQPVTFVFAARDETRNSALVLRDLLLSRIQRQ